MAKIACKKQPAPPPKEPDKRSPEELDKPRPNPRLVAALKYAERGWPVFPCYEVLGGGFKPPSCACGKVDCSSPGKHPRISNGFKVATTDKIAIHKWWKIWPEANVGIATGARSGFWALDVDEGGEDTLDDLQMKHNLLPDTVEAHTGGGGRHLLFKYDGVPIKNSAKQLGPGLDVRGDGGYIIAEPSNHVAGGDGYWWSVWKHPDDSVIAEPPAWLLSLVKKKTKAEVIPLDKGEGRQAPATSEPPRTYQGLLRDYTKAIWPVRLARLAEEPPDNRRNNILNGLAYFAGAAIKAGHLDAETAKQDLIRAGRACGLTDAEILPTIKSGASAGVKAGWAADDFFLLDCASGGHEGAGWCWEWLHQGKYVYDRDEDRWYRFRDHSWRLDQRGKVLKTFGPVRAHYEQAMLRARLADDKDRAGIFKKAKNRLKVKPYRERVLDFAGAGDSPTAVISSDWDCHPDLVGCANGVLDLSSRHEVVFRPGAPEDWIKKAAPVSWPGKYGSYGARDLVGLEAKAGRWRKFIDEIFCGDRALVNFVQAILGYGLARETDCHVFPIFWGGGRNGKSTLFSTLAHVLGPLIVSIDTALLMSKKYAAGPHDHTEGLMPLLGCKLAYSAETARAGWLDHKTVKLLTGGDKLRGRPIRGKSVEWEPTHLLIMLTNSRPKVPVTDEGLWERLQLVPFHRSFVDTPSEPHHLKREPGILEKLKAEADYILPWLVSGLLRYRRSGLTKPPAVIEAEADYRTENNTLALFLGEETIQDHGLKVQHKILWTAYTRWCDTMKLWPVPARDFRSYMESEYKAGKYANKKYYYGLELTENEGQKNGGGSYNNP